MRQKSFGLGWLDRNNGKQQQWACSYLLKKGSIEQNNEPVTHEKLLQAGKMLERSKDGQETIKQMRDAWRQKVYRDPNQGRKACTFKLKTEVQKELSSLAKKSGTDKTDLLSTLISDGEIAHTKLKGQLSNSQKRIDRLKQYNEALMSLLDVSAAWLSRYEILLQDASLSTASLTEDQQRRIEKLHRTIMSSSNTAIKSPGTLSPKRLFERAIRGDSSRHAPEEAATDTIRSGQDSPASTQDSPINRKPCVDSEPQRLSDPDTLPELDSALTTKDSTQITTHSAGTSLEAAPDENASPSPLEKAIPKPEPQSAAQNPYDFEDEDDYDSTRSSAISLKGLVKRREKK